jgi:hypothetical protein
LLALAGVVKVVMVQIQQDFHLLLLAAVAVDIQQALVHQVVQVVEQAITVVAVALEHLVKVTMVERLEALLLLAAAAVLVL